MGQISKLSWSNIRSRDTPTLLIRSCVRGRDWGVATTSSYTKHPNEFPVMVRLRSAFARLLRTVHGPIYAVLQCSVNPSSGTGENDIIPLLGELLLERYRTHWCLILFQSSLHFCFMGIYCGVLFLNFWSCSGAQSCESRRGGGKLRPQDATTTSEQQVNLSRISSVPQENDFACNRGDEGS